MLDHIAIQSYDFKKSVRFYKDVLDLKVIKKVETPTEEILWFDLGGGVVLELFSPRKHTKKPKEYRPYSVPGICHFGIKVASLEEAKKRLEEYGIPILRGPYLLENKK